MKTKKYIGQLISLKYLDWKQPIEGLVIDYNDEWTLLKYNPSDYIIDGYLIFRHKKIEGFRRNEREKFAEKVIKLKGLEVTKDDLIPIDDLETILTYITAHYGIFSIQTKSEKACYLGKLISINSKELVIKFLNTNGKWRSNMTFRPGDIRTIEFSTDYINSLKLIGKKQ